MRPFALAAIMVLTAIFASSHDLAVAQDSPTVRAVEFAHQPPATDFELPTLDDESLALTDFLGRFVLINFWATWCPPCVRELPSFNQLQAQFDEDTLTILAISSDEEGADEVLPFVREMSLIYRVLLDSDAAVSTSYGATHLPVTFLVNPEGKIVAAFQGERDWASDVMIQWFKEKLQSSG